MDMEEEDYMGWGKRWLGELGDCVLGRGKGVLGLADDAHVRVGAFVQASCVEAEGDVRRTSSVTRFGGRCKQGQGSL